MAHIVLVSLKIILQQANQSEADKHDVDDGKVLPMVWQTVLMRVDHHTSQLLWFFFFQLPSVLVNNWWLSVTSCPVYSSSFNGLNLSHGWQKISISAVIQCEVLATNVKPIHRPNGSEKPSNTFVQDWYFHSQSPEKPPWL